MKIGYKRVSSADQNHERQLEDVDVEKVFLDKASGKNADRPQLQAMMAFAREGDIVFVHSMDRLARNLIDLRNIIKDLTSRRIEVQLVKENLVFSSHENMNSNLLLNILGAFAEFERALIRERQKEGIAIAKKKGVYKGRKKALNADQLIEIERLLKLGVAKSKIARDFRVSRETIYNYIKEQNQSQAAQ